MLDSTDGDLQDTTGMDSSGDLLARTPSPRSKSPTDRYMLDEEDEMDDVHRPTDDSLIDFGFDAPEKKRGSRRPSRASITDDRQRSPSPTPIDDILSGVPTLPRRGSRSLTGMVPGSARGSIARQPTLPQSPPSRHLSPDPTSPGPSISRSSSHRSLPKPASSDFGQQVSDAELSDSSPRHSKEPDRSSSEKLSDRHSDPDRVSDHKSGSSRPGSRHSDRPRPEAGKRPDSRHSDTRGGSRPSSRHSQLPSPSEEPQPQPQPRSPPAAAAPAPPALHSSPPPGKPDSRHSSRHSDIDRLSGDSKSSDTDQQSMHSRHSDDIDMYPPGPPPEDRGQSPEGDGDVVLGDTSMKSTRV